MLLFSIQAIQIQQRRKGQRSQANRNQESTRSVNLTSPSHQTGTRADHNGTALHIPQEIRIGRWGFRTLLLRVQLGGVRVCHTDPWAFACRQKMYRGWSGFPDRNTATPAPLLQPGPGSPARELRYLQVLQTCSLRRCW